MSLIIVSHCLAVALQILQNCGPVKVKIWVGLSHCTFCLGVCLQGLCQLLNILVVDEEIREMCIAKNI